MTTAEEFLKQKPFVNDMTRSDQAEAMIEFAKMHVQEALEQASKKISIRQCCSAPYACNDCKNDICEKPTIYIEQSDILNAYPLDNIK